MIRTVLGDITKVEGVAYICNAANGMGPMGAGVAGAIKRAGGVSIQREAIDVCKRFNPFPGDLYETDAGMLPYKKIIHLVTMKNPGEKATLHVVEKCLQSLLAYCKEKRIKKVALPGLGTGIGRLSKEDVAHAYMENLHDVEDIEFIIIDPDQELISLIEKIKKNW